MVANWPLIIGITASVLAVGDLIYTYFRTRVRGPKFVLVNTRLTSYTPTKHEESDDYKEANRCEINIKILNIGDRSGIIFLNSNELTLSSTKDQGKYTKSTDEWSEFIEADDATENTFSFYIPQKHQHLMNGKLILKGYYFDHDGLNIPYKNEFRGKMEKDTIWKLQMNHWKKTWMKIRYPFR